MGIEQRASGGAFGKLTLIGLALAGLAVNATLALLNRGSWNIDFNQYYAAGRLVGTGRLYDWDSIRAVELEHTTRTVTFTRIPAFAVAFKPLTWLPWTAARGIWFGIGIAALAGFVWLWPGINRGWASVAVLWSMPVALCLATGQDSVLFLFFFALGLRLLQDGRDWWAGFVFSLCIAKPHLALLVPVLLIAQMRWKAIVSGAAGVIASIGVCFLSGEGSDWPHRLLTLTSRIDGHPLAGGLAAANFPPAEAPERMPNLRGLLWFFGGGIPAEIVVGLIVVVAVWFISRKRSVPVSGTIALAGGLLLSHHAYVYDALLLIPALILPFLRGIRNAPRRVKPGGRAEALAPLKSWAVLLATPVAYLFTLANESRGMVMIGQMAISGYVLVLIGVTLSRNMPERSPAAT